MEEKKLTDEEILNDLQLFSNLEIEEAKKQGAEKAVLLATLTLDLIRRLQQRVSILEADNDDYKMKLAENELVSIDWHNEQVGHLEEENAELQKQLDELKIAYKDLVEKCRNCTVEKDTAREIIQWIKLNGILEYGGYVIHDSTIEQMCKKYGVEVE